MYNGYPYPPISRGGGLLSGLLGRGAARGVASGIGWSGILSNTQKTLSVINQAIPICYQVKPMINNAKTMFRIIGAVKDDDNTSSQTSINTNQEKTTTEEKNISSTNKPIFYI